MRDMIAGMHQEDRLLITRRRLNAVEPGKRRVVQHALYGAQPIRPLGVAGRREVLQKDGVGVEAGDHAPI